MMGGFVLLLTILILPMLASAAPPDVAKLVTVRPEETDAILANPGMGWETFYRTAREDRNLPDWIPSTIHYRRWGWGELEPEPGRIDYGLLDDVLRRTRAAGQKLAFGVMTASNTPGEPYHPPWVAQIGRELLCTYQQVARLRVPDLDDPAVLRYHLEFIRRLGERYDGHPDIQYVDIRSVGWWGEWHMNHSNCSMPSLSTRRQVVDTYLSSFRKTRLLMLVNEPDMLRHATARGTGWRADCLGDMRGYSPAGFSATWNAMRNAYPVWLTQAGATEAWRSAPVAWERCWDIRRWVEEGWPLRYIFNYALALHGSSFNNGSRPLPERGDVWSEVERFLRRLGYRLVLRELSHPAEVKPSQQVSIAMRWQNTGSAPSYVPYRLAYRLTSRNGFARTFVSSRVTVDRWLPGSVALFTTDFFRLPPDLPPGQLVQVEDTIELPDDIPSGDYVLSLAVVGEESTAPVLRLGIRGRASDGWYPLSTLRVLH